MMKEGLAATIIVLLVLIASPGHSVKTGGISDNEKPMKPELKKTLEPLQPELKTKVSAMTNGVVNQLEPVAYKTQVVAGVNYFVKYKVGDSDDYIHARIFKPLKGNLKLVAVSGIKKASDPIEYFR